MSKIGRGIDSPPRKRDPLNLAARLARWSNDIGLDDNEAALLKDAAIELRAWHDRKQSDAMIAARKDGSE